MKHIILGSVLFSTFAIVSCHGGNVSIGKRAEPIAPPSAQAQEPVDYDGIHNVVTFVPGVYSGSVPEGDAGFETLARMGVKTIISVDGAVPDVERARAHGLRYVHLPISYGGIEPERQREIARAIRDLEGPFYVHCHHGKHRSAGAAASAAVLLGKLTPDEAIARMKVSGTSPSYKGLYNCVATATAATEDQLRSASNAFPEVTQPSGLVDSMVAIDETMEHLRAIEKAGWKVPSSHPDLVPAAEAGKLADLLRNLQDDAQVKTLPDDFTAMLRRDAAKASELEEAIVQGTASPDQLSASLRAITQSCKECHTKYRD